MANMYCSPMSNRVGNMHDAKRECAESGSTCVMFYNVCGEGRKFNLCQKGAVLKKSGCGSILYNKDNLEGM